MTHKMFLKNLR